MRTSLLLFILIFLATSLGLANEQRPEAGGALKDFQEGIQAFQQNDFEKAFESFQLAAEKSPENSSAFYNLGISAMRLKRFGYALAAFRRSFALNPASTDSVRGISESSKTLGLRTNDSEWEAFREQILTRVSFNQLLAVVAVFLGLSGFLLLKYAGLRRTALKFDEPLPRFPTTGLSLFIAFMVTLLLLGAKTWDHLQPRATVVAQTAPLRSGPTTDNPELFQLTEGQEVLLRQKNDTWIQVTYPGGLTGWLSAQDIFFTSGRRPW